MLAFAVLLAAVSGAALPPPMPVMRPVTVQPLARPVAPAAPTQHLSSATPPVPEMKKPVPVPTPLPYYAPYRYNGYYGGVRWPAYRCTNAANLVWLDDGWWCNSPLNNPCCPRRLLVP
jgi:hypothetical protein